MNTTSPFRKQFVGIALAFGLGLLIAVSLLVFVSADRYVESTRWKDHSDLVLRRMRDARIALEMAESSQRGFIITGKNNFKENYKESAEATHSNFAGLGQLVSDNPTQASLVKAVLPLIDEKIRVLNGGFELMDNGQQAKAMAYVQEAQGTNVMPEIRRMLQIFEQEEMRLYQIRAKKSEEDFRFVNWIVVGALTFAFGLFFLVANFLNKEIRRRIGVEKNLEASRAKAQQDSSVKSRFLANMSHEIRTPLNGIIGTATLLRRTQLTPKQAEYAETLKTSSNALLALINQILDISKIEAGKMQLEDVHFELRSLLASTLDIVDYSAKAKGLRILEEVQNNVPNFYIGDPLRIRQVLLNLLNNAIKFSNSGEIAMKVSLLSSADSNAELLFEVTDQGIGLDSETKSRLFSSFSQGDESTSRKFGGTGLGLAISKQIVELMKGTIDVESIPGVGSKFYFKIPLKLTKFEEIPKLTDGGELLPKKLEAHILIVEDNLTNQQVASEMISLLGCTFEIAKNGGEALELLNKGSRFDVILMDGQMPVMDGYESTERIRAGEGGIENKAIPILATTANAIKGDNEKCIAAGMSDYISKPISFDDLATKLEQWIQRGKNILDRDSLLRIETLSKRANKDVLGPLIAVFEKESAFLVKQMQESLDAGNFNELSRGAHLLKSTASNLGALRIRDVCTRIERLAPDEDERTLRVLTVQLGGLFEEAVKALHDLQKEKTHATFQSRL